MNSLNVHFNTSPIRIGLTGGIATGKTTVTRYLAQQYGLPILDADIYAREAVAPGSSALAAIVRRYGSGMLKEDGSLNRAELGNILFADEAEKGWIEAQIHPFVRDRFVAELARLAPKIAVLAIPLLFESQMTDFVNTIWVVACTAEQQLERLMNRDRLNLEQAIARIESQMPLAEKIAAADVVLENSGSLEALWEQIDRAIEPLLENRRTAEQC
ncbi:dephospho-CoA kinase [Oscillatoria sp. FACHB-1406]|uniref:dephospho-CoA kinase n=1 Tax=Oscillatoria sp. FACHB-1406 TaxID=2692846 RepID=UPI00322038EA